MGIFPQFTRRQQTFFFLLVTHSIDLRQHHRFPPMWESGYVLLCHHYTAFQPGPSISNPLCGLMCGACGFYDLSSRLSREDKCVRWTPPVAEISEFKRARRRGGTMPLQVIMINTPPISPHYSSTTQSIQGVWPPYFFVIAKVILGKTDQNPKTTTGKRWPEAPLWLITISFGSHLHNWGLPNDFIRSSRKPRCNAKLQKQC